MARGEGASDAMDSCGNADGGERNVERSGGVWAGGCGYGENGYGDGPATVSLAFKPANLTGEHLFHHGEGTLFWWVSNGIEGSGMPAFRDSLDEDQRWDVLQYLHAQADAE